jgi:hypothetical protein
VLIVFLHGDNGGRTELKADSGTAAMLAEKLQAVTIAMQRPGYRSDLGVSDGQSGPGTTTTRPAERRNRCRRAGQPAQPQPRQKDPADRPLRRRGHGGLAGQPLPRQRRRLPAGLLPLRCAGVAAMARQFGRQSRRLEPQPVAAGGSRQKPARTPYRLVVGNKDENTLPLFSESYAGPCRRAASRPA